MELCDAIINLMTGGKLFEKAQFKEIQENIAITDRILLSLAGIVFMCLFIVAVKPENCVSAKFGGICDI